MWFWIYIAILVLLIVAGMHGASQKMNAHEILNVKTRHIEKGRLISNEYFAREEIQRFFDECKRHSIRLRTYSVLFGYSVPDIATYPQKLSWEGLHIELIKEGLVRYKRNRNEYLGSPTWQKKWSHIIFSSNIRDKEFCKCIKVIMDAHSYSETDNINVENKYGDGKIKVESSEAIFRALYAMRYYIVFKENRSELEELEISNANQLKERLPSDFILPYYPKDNDCTIEKLSDLAYISKGCNSIYNYDGTVTKGDYYKILCLKENRICEHETYMVKTGVDVFEGYIVLGLNNPFDIKIWESYSAISEGIVSIGVKGYKVKCEYLFLFLKLMCHKLKVNGADKMDVEALKATNIIVVPAHIQREIIKKGMPVKHDAEQLEAVFSSYNEAYPMLRLISKQ